MKKMAIIGGGIIGMTLANYLDVDNYQITVFDEGIGQATSASAGIISPWLSKRRNKKWYELAKDGAAFYEKLVADFSLREQVYKKSGTLLLRPAKALPELLALAEERKEAAPEMGELRLLSNEETREKLPLLEAPALWLSGGGRLDGREYLNALKRQAEAKEIMFVSQRVTVKQGSHWEIVTEQGSEAFDAVAFCAGASMSSLLEQLGYRLAVRPQKGQLLSFQTSYQTDHWPVAMLDGESDLIPFANGQILVGATHENEGGFDLQPTSAAFELLKEKTLPFLSDKNFFDQAHQYRVGTRAYTPDFAPFFDTLPKHPEVVLASGLGSSGLTTGPYIGYLLAQYFNQGTNDWSHYQKPLENYLK